MFLHDIVGELNDDDLFAPSKAERIANALDKLADIFTQYQHSQQSVHYCRNLAKTFRKQGIDKGVVAWRQTRPDNNSQFANGGISRTAQIYVQKETGFNIADRYLDLAPNTSRDSNINESDDELFSTNPTLTQRIGQFIVNHGEGNLEWSEDLLHGGRATQEERDYSAHLKVVGAQFIKAGQAFLNHGMNAGMMEWVLIDSDDKENFYNFMREVENFDVEQILNDMYLKESDDDLFANDRWHNPWLSHYIGQPIIGYARIKTDLPYQDEEFLSPDESKFFNMQGHRVPVVDWIERTRWAIVLLGPKQPIKVKMSMLDNVDIDLSRRQDDGNDDLDESDDELFSPRGRSQYVKAIVDSMTKEAHRMIEDPIGFLQSYGWDGSFDLNDDDQFSDAWELTQEAGVMIGEIAEVFSRQGIDAGVAALVAMSEGIENHNNSVASWTADYTLSNLEDEYNINTTGLTEEEEETDDDLFAKSHRPNLAKINTQSLRQLYHMSAADTRPEYADAHRLQMIRISAELARRGIHFPTID